MSIVDIIYNKLKEEGIEESKAMKLTLGIFEEIEKHVGIKAESPKLSGAGSSPSRSKDKFEDDGMTFYKVPGQGL